MNSNLKNIITENLGPKQNIAEMEYIFTSSQAVRPRQQQNHVCIFRNTMKAQYATIHIVSLHNLKKISFNQHFKQSKTKTLPLQI